MLRRPRPPGRPSCDRRGVRTGTRSLQHPLQQTSVHRAHQFPVLLEEVPERTAPQGDLHGAGPFAPEARIESRFGQCLPEPGQVRPRTARTGRRGVPGDEIVAPFSSEGVGTRASAGPGRERRQDVRQQAVVTPLPVSRGHSGVDGLGAADGRRASPRLRRHEAGVREPTQVWTDRIGVQAQPGGELANGDRAAGQAQVPIEPVARVVRQGLVDLDRGRFVHLRISYDGLCTVRTVSTRA